MDHGGRIRAWRIDSRGRGLGHSKVKALISHILPSYGYTLRCFYFSRFPQFKCSIDHAKRSFYKAAISRFFYKLLKRLNLI